MFCTSLTSFAAEKNFFYINLSQAFFLSPFFNGAFRASKGKLSVSHLEPFIALKMAANLGMNKLIYSVG